VESNIGNSESLTRLFQNKLTELEKNVSTNIETMEKEKIDTERSIIAYNGNKIINQNKLNLFNSVLLNELA
jgi:hypothetical protein